MTWDVRFKAWDELFHRDRKTFSSREDNYYIETSKKYLRTKYGNGDYSKNQL